MTLADIIKDLKKVGIKAKEDPDGYGSKIACAKAVQFEGHVANALKKAGWKEIAHSTDLGGYGGTRDMTKDGVTIKINGGGGKFGCGIYARGITKESQEISFKEALES